VTPDDLVLTRRGVRFQGRLYPCTIGKTGVTHTKQEGDKATPAGIHRIVGMLYRPDRIPAPVPWAAPIGPRDLWSDDVTQPQYNSLVQTPYPHSHEALRRADPLYDLVVLTDWNWPDAVPGRGSAIFIHQQRRPGYPTEGCVAFSRAHLHDIAARLTRHSRLIV
jgi:L,D-peptidoglycan transpeptidase YkuD (ErfK/YbiS/YcfS/YnhG family)|tara:strand:- start:2739 stop:3230 length:492 start_codon:yes stop_codon:yes gene_type:complete